MLRTREELLVLYMKFNGFEEVKSRSYKYREFRKEGWHNSYFIGKHGAFRKGKAVTKSLSLNVKWPEMERFVEERLNQEVPI